MADVRTEQRRVEFVEPITMLVTETTALGHTYRTSRTVGSRRVTGVVTVTVDMDAVVRTLGRRALQNKSRRSVAGPITVKVVEGPTELSREMRGG